MFGSLKKRLQEAVEKVSKSIKDEPKTEQPEEIRIEARRAEEFKLPEKPAEPEIREKVAEAKEAISGPIEKVREAIEKIEPLAKEAAKIIPVAKEETPSAGEKTLQEIIEEAKPADFEKQIDRKIEELEELKEKVREERIPAEIVESRIETEQTAREEKRSLLGKITEKRLSESEIERILKELNIALLENDVAVEVAERISDDVKRELAGAIVKRGKVEDVIKEALMHAMLDVMRQEKIDLADKIGKKDGPFTIIFVGFNGVGKTTNLCKLAYKLKEYEPILAAADTFRAASIEQLEEHGKRLGLRVVKHTYGADSAAVIFDAKKHAAASGSKLVLADTAGRSHSNVNLMDELKKVVRVNNPDMKILVLDSVTGNDIYDQCKLFNDAVGVDAIILTKADVYERGGAALSAAYTLKKPILYVGIGQNYDDLKEFNPEEIVKNLVG